MDPIPEGLMNGLNAIRETAIQDNTLYGRSAVKINPTTPFATWAAPLLQNDDVMNDFIPQLLKRIVYTAIEVKYFNNPLRNLEGDEIPLGSTGQEIYVNPVTGRQFNPNDFAGLLCKYEADVKVQYNKVNAHWQYPMTVSYDNIRDSFTSWTNLNSFIDAQVAAIYNGFYIDDFNTTKGLVGAAYRENMVRVQTIAEPTDEATAKALIRQARAMYLNMSLPSTNYNAWSQIGGSGRPVKTWAEPYDIMIMIRNDLLALVDVDVLASAFNMDKTSFMGRVYGVDTFDQYDEAGNVVFDGSNIIMAIGDRRWFRIKPQMMKFDQFYNANNTTWQYYLRVEKMYNYSFFANMVVFATELPNVPATGLTAPATLNIETGKTGTINVTSTPANATTSIEFTSSDDTVATVAANPNNPRMPVVTAVSAGNATITATAGDVTAETHVTVTNPAAAGSVQARTTAKKTSENK